MFQSMKGREKVYMQTAAGFKFHMFLILLRGFYSVIDLSTVMWTIYMGISYWLQYSILILLHISPSLDS